MKVIPYLTMFTAVIAVLSASGQYKSAANTLPNLTMPKNGLNFKEIQGFEDYKIIATHFRTDKNELRYILANPKAYNALLKNKLPLPNGSKVVKIGWSVKKMDTFPNALEADTIQRVEYMIKDSKKYNNQGDHWGYARFVKKDGRYQSWENGTEGCISCHAAASSNDFLFSTFQKMF